ncbi:MULTISPECIES: MauE/DoxX family redox-associated membrane protein [unclassified Streptomyces]|uniref:MauE/DoxX family redox-associated membrane protein n=1 Tax=unclassified Streptomyces TaxID=2593676 RepID=UPI0033A3D73B
MTYLLLGCRALLLVVFLVAVAGKTRSRAAFAEFTSSVVALRLLSRRTSAAAAATVVVVELATTALLVVPATAVIGLALAVALLLAFSTGIVLALRRGDGTASCRCFGASATPLGRIHVVRNLALAVVGGAGLVTGVTASVSSWPPHPAGTVVTLAVALLGALLVIRLDDLAFLFTDPKRDLS